MRRTPGAFFLTDSAQREDVLSSVLRNSACTSIWNYDVAPVAYRIRPDHLPRSHGTGPCDAAAKHEHAAVFSSERAECHPTHHNYSPDN